MNPKDKIHRSWDELRPILYEEKLKELSEKILPNTSYKPERHNIFRAFSMPLEKIKVVILSQDPYPTGNNACGYAFINGTDYIPKSLQIIYKELSSSLDINEKNIRTWPDQGVFLLNTSLTVETGNADSHKFYWRDFTKKVIQLISKKNPCIWMLWGARATSVARYIHNREDATFYGRINIENIPISPDTNYIMTAPHPMVEYYKHSEHEFIGCDHFYLTNRLLEKRGQTKINW
jgi:uracil-DNA glycosylase